MGASRRSPVGPSLWLALLVLPAACRSEAEPSLVINLRVDDEDVRPEFAQVRWLVGAQTDAPEHRFPVSGSLPAAGSELGSVRVFVPEGANDEDRKLLVIGFRGETKMSIAAMRIDWPPAWDEPIVLTLAAVMPDHDLDGWPDEIDDDCVTVTSTGMRRCRMPDAGIAEDTDTSPSKRDLGDGSDVPPMANGSPCTVAGQCQSGFCADGICCATACQGRCEACHLPGLLGTCTAVPAGEDPGNECPNDPVSSCGSDGTCDGRGACRQHGLGMVCAPASCSDGTETPARTCDGRGTCQDVTARGCAPFSCGATTCNSTCAKDADCPKPTSCQGGKCGLKAAGLACGAPSECETGFCAQGVCCRTACEGVCRSCAMPASAGTCTNVPAGQDPVSECADQGAASCGTDGACDGAGTCRRYPAGTRCAPGTCTAGTQTSAKTCSARGVCETSTSKLCAPYGCGGTSCGTSCARHADCAKGAYCSRNVCTDMTKSLVGHWSFDETSGSAVIDTSGNAAPGSHTSIKTSDVPAALANGRSFSFQGAYARVPRHPGLEPAAVTISLWVKRIGNDQWAWAQLASKTWSTNSPPTYVSYSLDTNAGPVYDPSQVRFLIGYQGGVSGVLSLPGALPDQTWVHLAATYDPAAPAPQMQLFVNGTLQGSRGETRPITYDATPTGDVWMGAGPLGHNFKGMLDDVRIYNRALSAEELTAIRAGQ